MGATDFLHGIEVIEINDGARPISLARMSVIGVIGTAPEADGVAWPLNTPIPLFGRSPGKLGTTGTLPMALDGIFSQYGALVVVIRVPEGQSQKETLSNIIGSPTAKTGVYAFLSAQAVAKMTPRILIAPSFSAIRPADGIASIAVNAAGTNYTIAAVNITGDGTGATAEAVIQNGAIQAITITNPGLGYTTATATITGNGTGATLTVTRGAVRSPVVSHLVGIADRLRAIVVTDLPNTTTLDAISYRNDWSSARVFGADPWLRVWSTATNGLVTLPSSPFVAGVIAASDNERGVHWSPSSYPVKGVQGLARPIDHSLFNSSAESQILNSNAVATFALSEGFKLFGNRSFATDPLWTFLSVRRSADLVHESIEKGMAWALDRPFSMNNVLEVAASATDFLRSLKQRGGTLGGKVWFNAADNSQADIRLGKWTYHFDMEPPPPAERLTFISHRNGDYIAEVVDAASRRIAAL